MKKVTAPSLRNFSKPIVCTTAYDYTMARLADEAGVDVILVGDSLAMLIQGGTTTLPVTLDEMIYHTKCVAVGVERALVIGDMPFGSYEASSEQAVLSASLLMKKGAAQAVKLEGGVRVVEQVRAIVAAAIPVFGHIGLTPQSYHVMGGFKVQGRENKKPGIASAGDLLDDARALEDAGCSGIVLEGMPCAVAEEITSTLSIPTIGIGAGKACDGQILVCNDLLGMSDWSPKFVKRFEGVGDAIIKGFRSYCQEVRDGTFPSKEYTYK